MITLDEYLPGLPTDIESSERALEYQALLHKTSFSKETLKKIEELYKRIGAHKIHLTSYHDEVMVIYGLSKEPFLVKDVCRDVDKFLEQNTSESLKSLWNWVVTNFKDDRQQKS